MGQKKAKAWMTLRNVSMAMSLALVAATAAICLGLSITVADNALEDNKESSERGRRALLSTGLNSSENLAVELIFTKNRVILESLEVLFDGPQTTLNFLADYVMAQGVDGSCEIPNFANRSLRAAIRSIMDASARKGVTEISFVALNGPFVGGRGTMIGILEDNTTMTDRWVDTKAYQMYEFVDQPFPPPVTPGGSGDMSAGAYGTPDRQGVIVPKTWPGGCDEGTIRAINAPPLGCRGQKGCYSGRCPIPSQLGPESRPFTAWYVEFMDGWLRDHERPEKIKNMDPPMLNATTPVPGQLLVAQGWSPTNNRLNFANTGAYFAWTWTDNPNQAMQGSLVDFNQRVGGMISVAADVTAISQYCDTSGLPQGSRVFALERYPWKKRGNYLTPDGSYNEWDVISPMQKDGSVLGSSHGPAYKYNDNYQFDVGGGSGTRYRYRLSLMIENHTDYLIRTTGTWLVNEQLLKPYADSGAVKNRMIDGELWWILVSEYYNPHLSTIHPLTVRIVTMVKRDEAMRSILEQSDIVKSNIDKDAEQVDKEREDAFFVMIGVVIAVTVVLMVASIIFTLAITKPLRILAKEMTLVATMELDGIDESKALSAFKELQQMQSAFRGMVRNMRELRNFMPQSLLANDEPDPSDHDEKQSLVATSRASGSNVSPRVAKKKKDSQDGRKSGTGHGSNKSSVSRSRAQSSMTASRQQKAMEGFLQKMSGDGLKEKKITGVVINLVNSHTDFSKKATGDAVERHANACAEFLQYAVANKGIAEAFNGDRFLSSFNAVKPCAGHRVAACQMVDRSRNSQVGGSPKNRNENDIATAKKDWMTASVCTGQAKCGLLGCAGMKKFSLIGSSITLGYAIERLARDLGVGCIADQWVAQDVSGNFMMKHQGQLLFKKRTEKSFAVWELGPPKQASEDEWMYQLEEGEKADPNAAWNNAVQSAIAGQWDDAENAAAKISPTAGGVSAVQIQWLQSAITEKKIVPLEIQYH